MRNSHAYIVARMNNLFGGSVARLAKYRKARPDDWRQARYSKLNEPYPQACPGFNGKAPVLCAFEESALPVRGITFADDVRGAHIEHRGWFADSEGCGDRGTIRGIVAGLPHGRFIPGYYWSDNGEYVLFTGHVFDAIEDAARDADSEAERYAEVCREDNERFQAMCDAETICADKESTLREAWDEYRLAFEARHVSVRHLAKYREAMNCVTDAVRELRRAREELTEATAAYERG